MALSPQDAWSAALGRLQLQMTPAAFDTWLRDARYLAAEDGTFLIAVPNGYAQTWLERRLAGQIKRILASLLGRTVELRFTVQAPRATNGLAAGPLWAHAAQQPQSRPALPPCLDGRHTFDTFIPGPSNRLALSAARAVARPGLHEANPLYICSASGMGKTHLLQAAGLQASASGLQVLFATAEAFTNELIAAIRGQSTEAFRSKHRGVDLLLFDDLHFLCGKARTQEEFLHTLNDLVASGRQVVAAADRPPQALSSLCLPLRSRLAGGLVVDLGPPEPATRQAIARASATHLGAHLPPDTLALLASWPLPSVRELLGAVRRLVAYARAANQPPTPQVARRALSQLTLPPAPPDPTALLQAAASHFHLRPTDLRSRHRRKSLVLARQVAMYLLRHDAALPLQQIGALVGGRDHTTVLHACRKVSSLLADDPALQAAVAQIRQSLPSTNPHL